MITPASPILKSLKSSSSMPVITNEWEDIDSRMHKFNINYEYRIFLIEQDEFEEEQHITCIYMNSCTPFELYFNDVIDKHYYGCINVNNLSYYQYRIKGQRDIKPKQHEHKKYEISKIQFLKPIDKNKWTIYSQKFFNVHREYRLFIQEDDTIKSHNTRNLLIAGFIRISYDLENKGFTVIVRLVARYYNDKNSNGYINMEQVVKRELYFTPSTKNHWYGCLSSSTFNKWHYRLQGNCQTRVHDENNDAKSPKCYQIQSRDAQWNKLESEMIEFNINHQYRIRLREGGGYIVVERVTKNALYFGVSIAQFWYGCVSVNNLNAWYYVDKGHQDLPKMGNNEYFVYSVECKDI